MLRRLSACVAYEEGQDWVVDRMKSGYPRPVSSPVPARLTERAGFSSTAPSSSSAMRCCRSTASLARAC